MYFSNRWQALRDLGGAGERAVVREQKQGWCFLSSSYFEYDDDRLDTIAVHLLEQQMPDGGWNCRRSNGATHASVHTTISALEGLRHYELHCGPKLSAVRAAQRRGREFLLVHRLFRSHRTGNIIKTIFTRFSFPPRWHYDILRALDYFQAVNAPRALRRSYRHRLQQPARRPILLQS